MFRSARLCPLVWFWLQQIDFPLFPQLTPAAMFSWCFFFFTFCCCLSAVMMQESAMGTWMSSSSGNNNMPLSISQNAARSYNTTQHVIIPLLSLVGLSPSLFFWFAFVFLLRTSSSLTSSPSCQTNRRLQCSWVRCGSSGSSPSAPGLHNHLIHGARTCNTPGNVFRDPKTAKQK